MSKIKKQVIPRGVKLQPAHTHGTITDASYTVRAANLEAEQIEKNKGVFRCLWNTPNLSADYFGLSSNLYTIPFHFPPLNEFFSTQGITDTDTPSIHLREIGFYWDSRAEALAINEMAPDNRGYLTNAAERIGLKIKLYEKPISYFGTVGSIPNKLVYEQEFPVGSFSSELQLPLLPTFQDGLNIEIKPYHSYLWTIQVEGLTTTDPAKDQLCLPSLTITGKFISDLVRRTKTGDVALPTISNIPKRHLGNVRQVFINTQLPVAGETVVADDVATGDYALQHQIELVDDRARIVGLTGGYDEFSARANVESIINDSSYEVIAVNLMGGYKDVRNADLQVIPPATRQGKVINFMDRRIIPINYPVEIHKVYYWHGAQSPIDPANLQQTNFDPNVWDRSVPAVANSTETYELGVALGSHNKGTNISYTQVAYLNKTPGYLLTKVDNIEPYSNNNLGARPLWEMFQVPMVRDASILGVPTAGSYNTQDYHPTGPVMFVGKSAIAVGNQPGSSILTDDRVDVFDVGGAKVAPPTAGQENFLEVKLVITYSASGSNEEVVVPYGGFWVYLICKKTTVET